MSAAGGTAARRAAPTAADTCPGCRTVSTETGNHLRRVERGGLPAALVDSADAGRYEELSFFCTSDNLPWYAPPAPPTSSTSTATAMTAKNGTPRGNRAGSG